MRICRVAAIACVVLLGVVRAGRAQEVMFRVLHGTERTPLAGALVSLRGADGTVTRALTGPNGRISVRVARPGRYQPRADAIGFRGVEGDPIELDGSAHTIEFALDPAPFSLDELIVDASRSVVCDLRADNAQLTSRVWDEARKALFGTVISRTQDPPLMDVELYQRRLTPSGWVSWQQTAYQTVRSDRPFVAMDPDQLHQMGWVRKDAAGTLWLEPTSMELRSLEFRFVNLEIPDRVLRDARLGGHLAFDRLPTGGWYVRDWSIMTPFLQRRARINRTDYVVAWYQDVGGSARPEGTPKPPVMLAGQVFDSLAGRPLSGAEITWAARRSRFRTMRAGFGSSSPAKAITCWRSRTRTSPRSVSRRCWIRCGFAVPRRGSS